MERFWLALGAIQSVTLQAFAVWEGDLVLRKPLNSGWKILMQAVPQKRMGLQTSGQPPARGWNGHLLIIVIFRGVGWGEEVGPDVSSKLFWAIFEGL